MCLDQGRINEALQQSILKLKQKFFLNPAIFPPKLLLLNNKNKQNFQVKNFSRLTQFTAYDIPQVLKLKLTIKSHL